MRAVATNTTKPSRMLMILAFAAIYVLWGSSYLAIRHTIETLPPYLMAGVRAFVAGVVLFAAVGIPRLRDLTWAHWRTAIISGGLFFLGCHGLLFHMERTIDSGVAALILATIPGWMAILSCMTGQTALTARTLVGLLLGLAGVALPVLSPEPNARPVCSPLSACVLLVSALSWACGSLYGRSAPLPECAHREQGRMGRERMAMLTAKRKDDLAGTPRVDPAIPHSADGDIHNVRGAASIWRVLRVRR